MNFEEMLKKITLSSKFISKFEIYKYFDDL
jgi:hypothetical protein